MSPEYNHYAITILKLLGVLIPGALGVIGLLTETRNKTTNQITRWGRFAVFGIVSLTIVSIIAQILDSSKEASTAKQAAAKAQIAAEDARAQVEKSNQILHEVQRSLNPLKDVRVSYSFRVPLDDPSLASYRERLLKGVRDLAADYLKNPHIDPLAYVMIPDKTGGVEVVRITPKSPLFPQPQETVAFYLIRYSGVNMSFYRSPSPVSAFSEKDPSRRPHPDLEWEVGTSKSEDPASEAMALEYDFRSGTLDIVVSSMPVFIRNSDGSIISTIDLSGSQLVAGEGGRTLPWQGPQVGISAVMKEVFRIRTRLELSYLSIHVEDRCFCLVSDEAEGAHPISFTRFQRPFLTDFSQAVYLGTLPQDIGSLQKYVSHF